MKRLRVGRWSGQVLAARPSAPCPAAHTLTTTTSPLARAASCRTTAPQFWVPLPQVRNQSSSAAAQVRYEDDAAVPMPFQEYPSPPPERALSSAKLAALHARLSLPQSIPLQTLARALIDPSADPDPRFNNANLAFLGSSLLGYHCTEWLVSLYPRLPFLVLTEAGRAFTGPDALAQVARSWGIESVAESGGEVDPGLLQFSTTKPRPLVRRWGVQRSEATNMKKYNWRRGINSRVIHDDQFGDMVAETANDAGRNGEGEEGGMVDEWAGEDSSSSTPKQKMVLWSKQEVAAAAHADLVRALVGAIYAHCGREKAHAFIKAHVLSRQLNLASLFGFHIPTRELARLCSREGFDAPVARLLSETGRLSHRPVFVVGIYSGGDKLGEGSGPNPHEARASAAMNALKAWYLYSPGPETRLPSEMLAEDAKPWEPLYVDVGEII